MKGLIKVTYFENGTQMTSQLHEKKTFHRFSSSEKCINITLETKRACFLRILLEKLTISNFEMCSWNVIFVPFSEKFTYNRNINY